MRFVRFVNHSPDNLALEIVAGGMVWGDGIILAAGTSVSTPYRDGDVQMTISKHDPLGKPAIASYSVRGMIETATASTDRGVRTFKLDKEVVDLYFTFEPIDSVRCRDLTCAYVQSSPWNASTMEHDDITATSTITPIREPLWKDTPSSNRISFWNKSTYAIWVDMTRPPGAPPNEIARIEIPPNERRYYLARAVMPTQQIVKLEHFLGGGPARSMAQDPVVTGLTRIDSETSVGMSQSYTLNQTVTAGSEVTFLFTLVEIAGTPVADTPIPTGTVTNDVTTKVTTTQLAVLDDTQSHNSSEWYWGLFAIAMLCVAVCVVIIVVWFRSRSSPPAEASSKED
jgi:hypothetical protein